MIWKGGATECVRDDVCFEKENVVANDMQSATTWRGRRDLNPRAGFSQPTPLAGEPLRPLGYFRRSILNWRREWDSNPRTLARRRFSRPVPSTARTSLHKAAGVPESQALGYDTIYAGGLSTRFPKAFHKKISMMEIFCTDGSKRSPDPNAGHFSRSEEMPCVSAGVSTHRVFSA